MSAPEHPAHIADRECQARVKLLAAALSDIRSAYAAARVDEWLLADVYLKLAVDQIADAGILP